VALPGRSVRLQVGRRINVREMVFALFRQMLSVSNPDTGFASAGRLVMSQLPVKGLDQSDALTKRNAETFRRPVFEMPEILKAGTPAAIILAVTVITALASGFEQALVLEISLFDQPHHQQSWIGERFYQLSSHDYLLMTVYP